MTNIPILDLIAGMFFIYFLMSIISNSIFEGLSSIMKIRAKILEEWIKSALPNVANVILNHTLVNGVSKPGKSNAYLTGKNFSLVLVDIIMQNAHAIPKNLVEISASIDNAMLPDDLKRSLQLFIVEAEFNVFKSQHKSTTFIGWMWTLFFILKFFGLMIQINKL